MSPPATGDRAAEFARLLNFFDQLASRGKKPQTASTARSDATEHPPSRGQTRTSPLPNTPPVNGARSNRLKDFYHATTSVKMFGNAPNPPWPSYGGTRSKQSRKVSGSELSVTDSVKSKSSHCDREDDSSSVEDGGRESPAKFPLERQRRFTFKLMLHKLYGRDDWMVKVQEALEQSRKEYKPLSEYPKDSVPEKGRGVNGDKGGGRVDESNRSKTAGVHFSAKQDVSSHGRQRSLSVATHSMSSSRVPKDADGRGGMVRAVKRRCVGRRQSLNGPLDANTEAGQVSNGWVYDAMISQLEHETHYERGSLRGKGRRRSLSVANRSENCVGGVDGGRSRKRATTTTTAAIREGVEEANLRRSVAG